MHFMDPCSSYCRLLNFIMLLQTAAQAEIARLQGLLDIYQAGPDGRPPCAVFTDSASDDLFYAVMPTSSEVIYCSSGVSIIENLRVHSTWPWLEDLRLWLPAG